MSPEIAGKLRAVYLEEDWMKTASKCSQIPYTDHKALSVIKARTIYALYEDL